MIDLYTQNNKASPISFMLDLQDRNISFTIFVRFDDSHFLRAIFWSTMLGPIWPVEWSKLK